MKVTNTVDMDKVRRRVHAAIEVYGRSAASMLENEAKSKAPWTDRTSNARNSIQGEFSKNRHEALITLSGNVEYFIFLELLKEKRFAILVPTIRSNATSIFDGYKQVIK